MKAAEWLRARVPQAPDSLLDSMIGALPENHDSVADALARAAVDLYARVVAMDGGREAALPLLTADALLTHAFQAKAEEDPEGLAEFAERWGAAGEIGRLADEVIR